MAALVQWPDSEIRTAVKILRKTILQNSRIYLMGNGGSASTASHFATDLGVGSLNRGNPLKAFSLADNSAIITATGNDHKFEEIFSRQIRLMCEPEDVVFVISASGNSRNLVLAIEQAKKIGCQTIALTAFNGGRIAKMVDCNIHIDTPIGDYGISEDIHSMICHCIAELNRKSENSSK
jgi:D-sedoheptulose 7-phosphate isomerase